MKHAIATLICLFAVHAHAVKGEDVGSISKKATPSVLGCSPTELKAIGDEYSLTTDAVLRRNPISALGSNSLKYATGRVMNALKNCPETPTSLNGGLIELGRAYSISASFMMFVELTDSYKSDLCAVSTNAAIGLVDGFASILPLNPGAAMHLGQLPETIAKCNPKLQPEILRMLQFSRQQMSTQSIKQGYAGQMDFAQILVDGIIERVSKIPAQPWSANIN